MKARRAANCISARGDLDQCQTSLHFNAAKLARMHFIIIAIVVLALWGVWRLIRAQIEKGADAPDESATQIPKVTDADAGKSDQS